MNQRGNAAPIRQFKPFSHRFAGPSRTLERVQKVQTWRCCPRSTNGWTMTALGRMAARARQNRAEGVLDPTHSRFISVYRSGDSYSRAHMRPRRSSARRDWPAIRQQTPSVVRDVFLHLERHPSPLPCVIRDVTI